MRDFELGALSERTHRSIHLLEGVRAALAKSGQHDLANIVDLVNEDLRDTCGMVLAYRTMVRNRKDNFIVRDLKALVRMGGKQSVPVVMRVARSIVARNDVRMKALIRQE